MSEWESTDYDVIVGDEGKGGYRKRITECGEGGRIEIKGGWRQHGLIRIEDWNDGRFSQTMRVTGVWV
jgi:hypothetical protein